MRIDPRHSIEKPMLERTRCCPCIMRVTEGRETEGEACSEPTLKHSSSHNQTVVLTGKPRYGDAIAEDSSASSAIDGLAAHKTVSQLNRGAMKKQTSGDGEGKVRC